MTDADTTDTPAVPDRDQLQAMMGAGPEDGPDLMELMTKLKSEGGLSDMMQEETFETATGTRYSMADLLADVINLQRLDAKEFGKLHDVDIQIGRVTPAKMGWMLEQMVKGNPGPIIEAFNTIQDHHEEVFSEVYDSETFENYEAMKEANMFTKQNQNGGDSEEEQNDE